MSKPSLIIVLLEDGRQEMLIYRYLIDCGLNGNEITFDRSPSGEGSAESWVRKRFVVNTKAYRRRRARARTALIVMIDADAHTVQDRLNQLDQALTHSEQQTIVETEEIARLVPRRNVETWILCLNQQAVDEETDYKRMRNNWSELIPPASRTLFQWTRLQPEPPNNCVISLRAGVRELKRIKP